MLNNEPQLQFCGLIFDCDGVMIDSEDANRYFYNTILAALNLPPMTAEQEKFAFMATAKDALLAMTPKYMHEKLDETVRSAINYGADVMPRVKLMPGFLEFLKKAKENGLYMAIDTNRTAEGIERVLDFFALQDYFDPVISSSVAPPKPLPAGANAICKSWNMAENKVLFVGDSENDMFTAQNAGLNFAAFQNPALNATIHVSSFAQLQNILFGANFGSGKPVCQPQE